MSELLHDQNNGVYSTPDPIKCLYEGIIVPTALYGAEAWGMRSAERRKGNYYYYYYYYFGVHCARPGESEDTLSVQRPQPHTTNRWKEEKYRTKKNSRRQKRKSRSCQQESIGSALETRQSHTIKQRVTKIVPKRYREGHIASAILRSPTTMRRERVPMSNQSTTSNTRRHIRQRQCTALRMHWVTPNLK